MAASSAPPSTGDTLSIFLIAGAALALICANVPFLHDWYHHLIHDKNFAMFHLHCHGDEHHHYNFFHFLVNDVLMAFFFLLAGKEIREAMLPGGPLASATASRWIEAEVT